MNANFYRFFVSLIFILLTVGCASNGNIAITTSPEIQQQDETVPTIVPKKTQSPKDVATAQDLSGHSVLTGYISNENLAFVVDDESLDDNGQVLAVSQFFKTKGYVKLSEKTEYAVQRVCFVTPVEKEHFFVQCGNRSQTSNSTRISKGIIVFRFDQLDKVVQGWDAEVNYEMSDLM